jgi:hypothetical protein
VPDFGGLANREIQVAVESSRSPQVGREGKTFPLYALLEDSTALKINLSGKYFHGSLKSNENAALYLLRLVLEVQQRLR